MVDFSQLSNMNALMPVQAFQAGRDQRNQRIGGEFQNALLEGNLDQARTLAQRSGDADMMGEYRSAIQQMNEQQRAEALRRTQVLGGAAEWALQNVPPDQLDTYVRQQLAPQLAAAGYDIGEYLPNGMPITQDALGTFVAMAQGAAGELTAYLDRNPGTREIGQYDAIVTRRGGQDNAVLNQQGTRALDEQNRSNQQDEALRGRSINIDAGQLALGRDRLAEDRRQFDVGQAQPRDRRSFVDANGVRRYEDTGEPVFASDVQPADGSGGGQTITIGAEQRARIALNIAPLVQANQELLELEQSGVRFNSDIGNTAATALSGLPFGVGDSGARIVGGNDFQAMQRASSAFESAMLPILSGAAVTDSEARRTIRAALPQPGDSDETLRRKRAHRQAMVQTARLAISGQPVNFDDLVAEGLAIVGDDVAGRRTPTQNARTDQPVAEDDLTDRASRYLVQ